MNVGLAVGIVALALAAPALLGEFMIHTLTVGLIYAVLAASWDLMIGFAGLISFGHAAFFGVGAYAAALVTARAGLPAWVGLPIGGIAGALLGLVIGLPTLRLRSVYLALATLAFGESLRVVAVNWIGLTHGTLGFSDQPTLFRLSGAATQGYYSVLAIAAGVIATIWWITHRTALGLGFQAIRDDEIRAAALGIPVIRRKLAAFALGGGFAGIAGALDAGVLGLVSPVDLSAGITMLVIAMTTIGGIGTIIGPAIAAVGLYLASEGLRGFDANLGQIGIGVLLMLFVLLIPGGLAGLVRRG